MGGLGTVTLLDNVVISFADTHCCGTEPYRRPKKPFMNLGRNVCVCVLNIERIRFDRRLHGARADTTTLVMSTELLFEARTTATTMRHSDRSDDGVETFPYVRMKQRDIRSRRKLAKMSLRDKPEEKLSTTTFWVQ